MESKVLLCVDDDSTMLTALRALLGKALGSSATLEVAESGAEAMEICAELQAEGRELSVVVSDFIMPGMRGDELLVRIHEKSPHTIKIMLTGQCDHEGVKRSIDEANLYRFMEKPFNNADLVMTAILALKVYGREHDMLRQIEKLKADNQALQLRLAQGNDGRTDPADTPNP